MSSSGGLRAVLGWCALAPVVFHADRAHAAMASFVAAADGDVTVLDAGGTTVIDNESTIDFGPLEGTADEAFGILEFDLTTIDEPTPLTVLSATLTGRFDAVRIMDSDVDFVGYVANLNVEGADASAGGGTIGSLVDINQGMISVPIDTSFVEEILNSQINEPLAGIRAIVTEGTLIRMESTEWPGGTEPPTLTVEYIPEPATLALLLIGACVVRTPRSRHG